MEKQIQALQLKIKGMWRSTGATDRMVQISIVFVHIIVNIHLFVVLNIPFSIVADILHQITTARWRHGS